MLFTIVHVNLAPCLGQTLFRIYDHHFNQVNHVVSEKKGASQLSAVNAA